MCRDMYWVTCARSTNADATRTFVFCVHRQLYGVSIFIEGIRIDPAHHVGGLRINQWVSLVIFSLSILVLATDRWRGGTVQLQQPEDAGSTVDTYE